MDQTRGSTGPARLFKALFILLTVLVLLAVGYTAWLMVAYWNRVGV